MCVCLLSVVIIIVMEWWSVEGQDTGSGVSKNGDHSRRKAMRVYCTAAENCQHTQNPHSHAWIRERRGPQGTHAIATIKSALWTTKWLTIVFPWPAQIQFPRFHVGRGGEVERDLLSHTTSFKKRIIVLTNIVEKSWYDSIYTHAFNDFRITGDRRNNK